ncbi:MAG: hypothetical protein JSW60_04260 [Thermoplasmatales archaeon]|nr:MAG: hypothetical protein JSW60_04260 [Thermoplasmatales archaeon]
MKLRRKPIYLLLNFLIVGVLLLSGCEETPKDGEIKKKMVYIEIDNDDGYVAITPFLSGGVTVVSDQQLVVGLFTSSDYSPDGNNFISRGIFRFNILEWNNTNITFYLKCITVKGNPGRLEVYLVDDPGLLTNYFELQDVSPIWNLIESSDEKIAEITPSENKWLNVTISKDMVNAVVEERYTNNEYMTFMLKLLHEDLESYNNYYGFASVDYTPENEDDQPYLLYEEH